MTAAQEAADAYKQTALAQTGDLAKARLAAGVADSLDRKVERILKSSLGTEFDKAAMTRADRLAAWQARNMAMVPGTTAAKDWPDTSFPEDDGLMGATTEEFERKAGQTDRRLNLQEAKDAVMNAVAVTNAASRSVSAQASASRAKTAGKNRQGAAVTGRTYPVQLNPLIKALGDLYLMRESGQQQDKQGKWTPLTPEEKKTVKHNITVAEYQIKSLGGNVEELRNRVLAPGAKPPSSAPPMGAGAPGSTTRSGAGVTLTEPGASVSLADASRWVTEALRKGGPLAKAIRKAKATGYKDIPIYISAHSPR